METTRRELELALFYAESCAKPARQIALSLSWFAGGRSLDSSIARIDGERRDEVDRVARNVASIEQVMASARKAVAVCAAELTAASIELSRMSGASPGLRIGDRLHNNAHEAMLDVALHLSSAIRTFDDNEIVCRSQSPVPLDIARFRENWREACEHLASQSFVLEPGEFDSLLARAKQEHAIAVGGPEAAQGEDQCLESEPDGPAGAHQWRVDGQLLEDTMRPGAWRMVAHLWNCADRCESFDGLLVPVYDDPEHIADAEVFGSLRRDANAYLNRHQIPWRVSLSKTQVRLKPAK